jgi:photosystem II stability/assembly factor-like uncharacterized protein
MMVPKTTAKKPAKKPTQRQVELLIGTRKGAFILSGGSTRRKWTLGDPIFLGHIVYHMVPDPRDKKVVLMAAKTGHLGPTVYRSQDYGATWTESASPPSFPKVASDEKGRAVDVVFWLSPGHKNESKVWYAGTSPPGLFRSENNGKDWQPVSGFNDHRHYQDWTKLGPTPGGQLLHSILIHPQNPKHMYLGISVGGVFESTDQGKDWAPLNRGCAADFMPDPNVEYGHDPHCVVMHPDMPERLYQQNHCGIYRLDRPSSEWVRIGKNMPTAVGDIGFPIVLHPRDPECAWVFPMDGTTVWPRTSPDGKPATFVTYNGGKTWKRQSTGLPRSKAYFTVKRQAMCADSFKNVGLYFGTSQGEVWGSLDEGESWECLVSHLPEIYSLAVLER